MSNLSLLERIYNYLVELYRWYLRTPERSLEAAYQAALRIQKIEADYFNGGLVASNSPNYSSIDNYFESDLKKQLKIVRMRLTEFNSSRGFLAEPNKKGAQKYEVELLNPTLVLEKLKFIDSIISKYANLNESVSLATIPSSKIDLPKNLVNNNPPPTQSKSLQYLTKREQINEHRSKAETTGILPRSILNTVNRIQVELDPEAEKDVVRNFRKAQRRTIISVRFLLFLIIIPVLAHQLSKTLVVGPLVNKFRPIGSGETFLNQEMEEQAFSELKRYEEKLQFQSIIGLTPTLSEEEKEAKVQAKAQEIATEFQVESANAIKNVFADIFSVIAVIIFLLSSQQQIVVLKDFFDHIVYGLSDSAKAFIIILFTDIFVGFHSPHGWEVILEGVSRHWGLAANHEFIFLFIATFPVILDTIFKYWIFRYLNRVSPSAVATYRNMNE